MSSYRYYKLTRGTIDQRISVVFSRVTSSASRFAVHQSQCRVLVSADNQHYFHTTQRLSLQLLRQKLVGLGQGGDVIQLSGLGGALNLLRVPDSGARSYNVHIYAVLDGQTNVPRRRVHVEREPPPSVRRHYQHNYNYISGLTTAVVLITAVYQLGTTSGAGTGVTLTPPPAGREQSDVGRDAAAILGIVSASQLPTLAPFQIGVESSLTPAFDQSTILTISFFQRHWHMKPTITLTYGLGWTLEMPRRKDGKQVELVDQAIN